VLGIDGVTIEKTISPMKFPISSFAPFLRFFTLVGLFVSGGIELSADPIDLPDPINILNQQRMAGEFLGYRPKAETNGIVLSLQSISDLLGNTTGGEMRGGSYAGVFNLGLAMDLQKCIGWEGASFKNTWLWLYGNDVSQHFVGNSLTASSIYGQPGFRCYELWIQQDVLHDAISLRGGLIPVDTEFMVSDTANLFVNSAFGPLPIALMNLPNGGPTYPMATPGLRLALTPTPWLTLRTAFTQGNPFEQQVNKHGFDWNFGSAGGLLNINEVEADWCKGEESAGLPGYAKFGFWFQTGQGPQDSEENGYNFASPTASAYNNGFYGIIDQKLYAVKDAPAAPDSGNDLRNPSTTPAESCTCSTKGLSSFARIGFSPEQSSVVGLYADTGLAYTGLIPTRDADKLGLAFGYAQVGPQQLQNAASEGTGASFEAVAELTYSARLTPAIAIQPDLQYILHPGGTQQYGNALVVGMRAVVDF